MHQDCLGAIVVQEKTIHDAKLVAIASQTTSETEKCYSQIDLEAMA